MGEETPWDDWAEPFIEWYRKNNVTPIAVEHMIGEGTVKIVGSVDFIGKDASGEAFLADYKCRSNCKGRASSTTKICISSPSKLGCCRRGQR